MRRKTKPQITLRNAFIFSLGALLLFAFYQNRHLLSDTAEVKIQKKIFGNLKFKSQFRPLMVHVFGGQKLASVKMDVTFYFQDQASLKEFESQKKKIKEFISLDISLADPEDFTSIFGRQIIVQKIKRNINDFLSSGGIKEISLGSVSVIGG